MHSIDPSRPVHASCVALGDRAALILGASGSGKSALALTLMAYGAALVSDDRTTLTVTDGIVYATAPDTIAGRIEARGVGILTALPVSNVPVQIVVDLDSREQDRLPSLHHVMVKDVNLPLLYRVPHEHFAAAILQILRSGRSTP